VQTLLMLKGPVGIGKSTLSRALGRRLHWPIIDKDDYSDVLLRHLKPHGEAAYDYMFAAVRALLGQGFSVICDSPLRGHISYKKAEMLAREAHSRLYILECHLDDDTLWRERIESRARRPAHIIQTWQALLNYRKNAEADFDYQMPTQTLQLDMAEPLENNLERATAWLKSQQVLDHREIST
jgi:predicted kinase